MGRVPLRGVSKGHVPSLHPPPSGMQLAGLLEEAGRHRLGENTEGSKSVSSGNEIAPRNNERATFPTFCVSVHSTARIVLAPGEI